MKYVREQRNPAVENITLRETLLILFNKTLHLATQKTDRTNDIENRRGVAGTKNGLFKKICRYLVQAKTSDKRTGNRKGD